MDLDKRRFQPCLVGTAPCPRDAERIPLKLDDANGSLAINVEMDGDFGGTIGHGER
jgi:hypothetical protein